MPVELGGVRLGRAQQEGAFAVGVERPGGELGVQVLEAVARQVGTELRMRRAAHPKWMPGAVDVVQEPRRGEMRRLDRTPEPVVALQNADVPAALRKQRRAGKAVDPAADDDCIVLSQRAL